MDREFLFDTLIVVGASTVMAFIYQQLWNVFGTKLLGTPQLPFWEVWLALTAAFLLAHWIGWTLLRRSC